jgi:hypothetical protein
MGDSLVSKCVIENPEGAAAQEYLFTRGDLKQA